MAKNFYRINQFITAQKVRVVDQKGKQLGVMTAAQALKQAQKEGLDLVEVAPKAQPPVCKLINFEKFKFLAAKKHQQEKKKSKKVNLKEIRLTPFIAENDLNFRLKRGKEFLKNGDRVKLVVRFRGRQLTKKEFGYQLLKKAVAKLGDFGEVEKEPGFLGYQLEMTLKPRKGDKSEQKKTQN